MIRPGVPRGEVRILAPAKINLGLAILGRRSDGFHELQTIFQEISLCDRIRLRRRRRGVRLICPALPELGEGNLAYRAAEVFLRGTSLPGGVEIDLIKKIPIGGGLGGGSSDAAAVLMGCCRLFGVRPESLRLPEWAAALGSDVPFFLTGGAALGTGRGDIINPLPPWAGEVSALICTPAPGLSTAAVFRALDPAGLTSRAGAFTILSARWREGDLRRFGAALFNDLEAPAFLLAPDLAAVKRRLLEAGADGAGLSGSGSTVYGLFNEERVAEAARQSLRGKIPGLLKRVRFRPARRRWGVVKR